MKTQSWFRKNWLWAAGGAFVSIHIATWLLQRAARSAARTEATPRENVANDKPY
uniref:Uncharacterized protein n=1 Tax=Cynoglossus semilaevis TaxID=244447 RepID=A0A3P8UDW5_CYNSE